MNYILIQACKSQYHIIADDNGILSVIFNIYKNFDDEYIITRRLPKTNLTGTINSLNENFGVSIIYQNDNLQDVKKIANLIIENEKYNI